LQPIIDIIAEHYRFFIVSHGLRMILCQQSAFIISAVLVSTLKYIFHSKF